MSVRERDLCATGKTRLVLEQNLSALVVHAGGVSSHGKSRVNSRLHVQMTDQARTCATPLGGVACVLFSGRWIGVGPRHELANLAAGWRLRCRRDRLGIYRIELAGFDWRADHVRMGSALIRPANRAFLRLRAIGRMARSTTLVSISIRPTSRKRRSPDHSFRASADGLGDAGAA